MRETGTGQQVAQLHERLMMMITNTHRRNLADKMGGVGTIGITKFNLRRIKFRNTGKIGLNQSLMYIYPFPPHCHRNFFICPFLTQ